MKGKPFGPDTGEKGRKYYIVWVDNSGASAQIRGANVIQCCVAEVGKRLEGKGGRRNVKENREKVQAEA